jgi:hypothetical protein
MNNRTKFYCWLIGRLEHRRMTLEEISDAWANAASNPEGKELSIRTFHRYREEIAANFGLEIECDKSDGYRYYIRRDPYVSSEITDWMLSALRIASLGDMLKYHDRVMLEGPPANTEMLDDILGAIDKRYTISFHYRNPYGEEWDMKLVPAFVRLFHQRWYVIGNKIVEGQPDEFRPRVLPFDRISQLEICCKAHPLRTDIRRQFVPERFYTDCFGIVRQDNLPAEDITIRAFYPQNSYVDEVPLHKSQTKIRDGYDYSDYRLHLSPTDDFLQELLWHGRKITVLSPDSLRQEMLDILKDMTESYATGKNTVKE